jgi:Putative Ig domain
MSGRLRSALAIVILAAAACTPGQSAQVHQTPVAQAGALPSHTPSATPSPIEPLRVASAGFHAGELGFAYTTVSLKAAGGVPPYHWRLDDGTLPVGLEISDDGKVTGVPTATGSYLFSVRVDDSAGRSATVNSSIGVTKHITVSGICTQSAPCSVEAGCVTVCGVFGVLSGGVSPIRYRVTSGAMPTGMGLGAFALTKAFPAPSSPSGKDWLFTVTATDAVGATARTTASFHVFPHITVVPPVATSCKFAGPCTFQLAYTLGTPNFQTPTAKATVAGTVKPLPVATASAAGGTANVNVTPPSTCPAGSKWTVTLVVTDASPCAANTYCASRPVALTVTC